MTHKKYILRVRKVAQWVKALIAQPHHLSSMPRINMAEGEIKVLKVVFDHHTCATAQTHTQINKCLKEKKT